MDFHSPMSQIMFECFTEGYCRLKPPKHYLIQTLVLRKIKGYPESTVKVRFSVHLNHAHSWCFQAKITVHR